MTEIKIDDNLLGKEFLQMAFDRCIKCSTCKYGFKNFEPSCPSGEKFLFESYWASGRIRLIRGLILGDLDVCGSFNSISTLSSELSYRIVLLARGD